MNPYHINYPANKFQSQTDVENYMKLVSTFFNNPVDFKPYPHPDLLPTTWVVDNANDWICIITQHDPNTFKIKFSYRYGIHQGWDGVEAITKWVAFRTGGVFCDIISMEDIDFG